MNGERIRQVNNIVITQTKDGVYHAWNPDGVELASSTNQAVLLQKAKQTTVYTTKQQKPTALQNVLTARSIAFLQNQGVVLNKEITEALCRHAREYDVTDIRDLFLDKDTLYDEFKEFYSKREIDEMYKDGVRRGEFLRLPKTKVIVWFGL